jgi:hypothetical protein
MVYLYGFLSAKTNFNKQPVADSFDNSSWDKIK